MDTCFCKLGKFTAAFPPRAPRREDDPAPWTLVPADPRFNLHVSELDVVFMRRLGPLRPRGAPMDRLMQAWHRTPSLGCAVSVTGRCASCRTLPRLTPSKLL